MAAGHVISGSSVLSGEAPLLHRERRLLSNAPEPVLLASGCRSWRRRALTGKGKGGPSACSASATRQPGREYPEGDPRAASSLGWCLSVQREFTRQSYVGGISPTASSVLRRTRTYGADGALEVLTTLVGDGTVVGSETVDESSDSDERPRRGSAQVNREGRGFRLFRIVHVPKPDVRRNWATSDAWTCASSAGGRLLVVYRRERILRVSTISRPEPFGTMADSCRTGSWSRDRIELPGQTEIAPCT